MHSHNVDYTNPPNVHRFENYGSFENSGSFKLDRGVVNDKIEGLCNQIFCPTHFYSGGTCIAATRVFTVMTVGTAAIWGPGTWLWVSGFNVVLGKVLVGTAASFTGVASLLTCVRDDNDRRCCSDVIGCVADMALISILVCD